MGLMKHAEEPQEDDDRDRDSDKPQKNAAHEFHLYFLTFPKRQPVDEVPHGSWVFHCLVCDLPPSPHPGLVPPVPGLLPSLRTPLSVKRP